MTATASTPHRRVLAAVSLRPVFAIDHPCLARHRELRRVTRETLDRIRAVRRECRDAALIHLWSET